MFVRIIPYLHAHTSCTHCTSFYSHWSAIKRQVFWGPGFLNLGTTSGESRGTPGGQKSPLKSRENRMVNHKSMGFLSDFQRKKQKTWWTSMESMVFSKKQWFSISIFTLRNHGGSRDVMMKYVVFLENTIVVLNMNGDGSTQFWPLHDSWSFGVPRGCILWVCRRGKTKNIPSCKLT